LFASLNFQFEIFQGHRDLRSASYITGVNYGLHVYLLQPCMLASVSLVLSFVLSVTGNDSANNKRLNYQPLFKVMSVNKPEPQL